MACHIIAERSVPTAIVVPNTELVSQWRKSFEQFLPGTPVGQYSGQKKKLSGSIDIITAQSISRSASKTDFLQDYGQVIADECHRVGAAGLTNALADLNVRYFLGLTATPYRSDGVDRLLPLIYGPVRHTMSIDRPGPKHYVVHDTSFTYDEPFIFWPDLDTALAADASRNSLISSVAAQAVLSGDNVLVLTKRRDQIPCLRQCLTDAAKNVPIFELHGGQSAKERKTTLQDIAGTENFILLAMSQVAGEGIDLPALNALVLAAPVAFKGNVIQQVGRVTRDASGTSASAATVHDFHDKNVPALAAAFPKTK